MFTFKKQYFGFDPKDVHFFHAKKSTHCNRRRKFLGTKSWIFATPALVKHTLQLLVQKLVLPTLLAAAPRGPVEN